MNVGRSLRLDFRDERGPDVHRAIADGDFGTAARLLGGVDVTKYDSVQFRHMHGGTWPAEARPAGAFCFIVSWSARKRR